MFVRYLLLLLFYYSIRICLLLFFPSSCLRAHLLEFLMLLNAERNENKFLKSLYPLSFCAPYHVVHFICIHSLFYDVFWFSIRPSFQHCSPFTSSFFLLFCFSSLRGETHIIHSVLCSDWCKLLRSSTLKIFYISFDCRFISSNILSCS